MPALTYSVLETDFFQGFHCVADRCRQNCCNHPWQITMDKASYKKLRALKKPDWLVQNFSHYIRRMEENNPATYAQILQGEKGCTFQDEQGLCKMHAQLGAEYLCHTCRSYPRSHMIIKPHTTLEHTVCSSCEEVARMLLAHREPIQFVTSQRVVQNASSPYALPMEYLMLWGYNQPSPLMIHYHLIRSIAIALLQAREYPFDQRMMLAALFFDKLYQMEQEGKADEVPAYVEQFVAAVEQGLYNELLQKEFSVDNAVLFANYASCYGFGHRHTPAGLEMLDCLTQGESQSYDQRMSLYQSFMAEYDYFVEHIFVNELFRQQLPLAPCKTIAQCSHYLVSSYAIFRFTLSAYLAGLGAPPSDTQLIDFVAFFGKNVLHDNQSFDRNTELLEKNDMTTLPHLLAIIKG